MKPITRRALLKYSTAIAGLTAVSSSMAASILTPRTTEGPFYPKPAMRQVDTDNDLVKVADAVTEAGGEIIVLKGQLLSSDGQPLVGHRIEIWQCDFNGRYHHPRDGLKETRDNAFQGFGHDMTDAEGWYQFRTIKPTTYPGRAPHIHVKVLEGDRELLTTQFYIADYKFNGSDGLYRRLSPEQAESVSMVFIEQEGRLETQVDVVI